MNDPISTNPPTELSLLQARLHTSEERLRLVMEGVDDHAIFAVDRALRIETWSVAAARLTGFSAAEALGQSAAVLQAPRDRDDVGLDLHGAIARGTATGRLAAEVWVRRRDGVWIWCHLAVAATH